MGVLGVSIDEAQRILSKLNVKRCNLAQQELSLSKVMFVCFIAVS